MINQYLQANAGLNQALRFLHGFYRPLADGFTCLQYDVAVSKKCNV